MKTTAKLTAMVTFMLLIFSEDILAQRRPPHWAPAYGYRAKTRHIYFPQYNMYYDMNRSSYLYLSGNRWTVSASLPNVYVGVNLGNAAQIQLSYNNYDPYRYNSVHVVEYRQYCDDGHHHRKHHGKKGKKHHKHRH